MTFIDLDLYIEEKYHTAIPLLFQKYGESVFRQLEFAALQEVLMTENAVNQELLRLQQEPVSAHEIQKVANKFENNFLFSQYKASDRALSLCYFEMIESPDLVNSEPDNYRTITPEDILRVSRSLSPDRCSTLIIHKQSSDN